MGYRDTTGRGTAYIERGNWDFYGANIVSGFGIGNWGSFALLGRPVLCGVWLQSGFYWEFCGFASFAIDILCFFSCVAVMFPLHFHSNLRLRAVLLLI